MYTHDERGHVDEGRIERIVAREGSQLERASAYEDEKLRIDWKGRDEKIGNFKLQFKNHDISLEERLDLLKHGIIPVSVDHNLLVAGDRNSMSFQGDQATDYARNLFWSQVEALAPLATKGDRHKNISVEEFMNALEKARDLMPPADYVGPQSFSP